MGPGSGGRQGGVESSGQDRDTSSVPTPSTRPKVSVSREEYWPMDEHGNSRILEEKQNNVHKYNVPVPASAVARSRTKALASKDRQGWLERGLHPSTRRKIFCYVGRLDVQLFDSHNPGGEASRMSCFRGTRSDAIAPDRGQRKLGNYWAQRFRPALLKFQRGLAHSPMETDLTPWVACDGVSTG